ncbi:MAG: membrane protein insertion efficiency factor YidD [Candidatus Omnitrophota bacterium]|nr:membrane protein insertion efficiency factor YidD [Candidatus Omnitrophota bacterium]
MGKISISLIGAYQVFARHFLPRTCRFYPTCSSYAKEAIERYGFCKGSLKALFRIIRCSPLSKGGHDPVR